MGSCVTKQTDKSAANQPKDQAAAPPPLAHTQYPVANKPHP